MSDTERRLNRRELLASTAIGGATLAAGSYGGLAHAFEPASAPAKWDRETDVLVVGYGAGGSAAALEAVTAGAEVIVLERLQSGGGAMKYSGGLIYMGGGTALQRSVGMEDTVDNMYKYLTAAAGYGADTDLIGVYCDKSVELYDWLVTKGVKFKETFLPGRYRVPPTDDGLAYSGNELQEPYCSIAKPVPRGHHVTASGFSGHALHRSLDTAVKAAGVQIIYDAHVRSLVLDSSGRVVGVVAQVDGIEQYIGAKRGVVLTTGGFGANKAMVQQHCPRYSLCGTVIGTEADDGSGIRMGQSIGADVRLMGEAIASSPVFGAHENLVKGILINERGQRFIGEDNYSDWVGDLMVRNHPVSYLLIDADIMRGIPEHVRKTITPDASSLRIVATAQSIAALADALKLPAQLLENTVRQYNEMSAAGNDIELRKNKKYLQGIKVPPFYALDLSVAGAWFVTTGGLRINKSAQVLDTNGKAIAGLFAAGTTCSQVIGEHYPGSGTLIGQALTFGRIAGRSAGEMG